MSTSNNMPISDSPQIPVDALKQRRIDPILQELYDVKAALNAEAGYSVEKIFERLRQSAALHKSKT
jgi:hypothetical protein